MKKSILLAIALIASYCSFGQQYSFVKQLTEIADKVYPAKNGSFYTLSVRPDCPDDIITVRFHSAQGTVLSQFSSPGYIGYLNKWDAVVTPSNHIVLALRLNDINELLYEFDSSGTMIWNNNLQYTSPQVQLFKLLAANNGGYYLMGNTIQANTADSSMAILVRLDAQGKHVWTKTYKMNSTLKASVKYNDFMVEDNRLMMAGRYYYTSQIQGQPPYRPIISLLDTAGNMQQSYYYMLDSAAFTGFTKYEFVQVEKTSNGNYYALLNNYGNEHAIIKLNSQFNIVWEKERLAGKALSMMAGYNEDLFIVPESAFQNSVLRIDSAGTMLGGHALKYVAGMSTGGIINIKKHDCGFLVSSNYSMFAHTNKLMEYCMDSVVNASYFGSYHDVTGFYRNSTSLVAGTLAAPNNYLTTLVYTPTPSPTSTAICSQAYNCSGGPVTNEVKTISTTTIDLYPNPATNQVKLTVPDAGTSYDVVMMDISGKQVLHTTLQNSSEYTISLPTLATGLYTVRVVGAGNVYVKKLQVLE